MKNKYPHFNPEKYQVDVKMAKVRSGRHCKHNINYHIVWIPKYRKKVLEGEIVHPLINILKGQCKDLDVELLALEVMPDHIHIFVGAKPTHTPFKIVNQLKGNSSRQLRLLFKDIKYLGYPKRWKGFKSLWADGYYCGSAGHVSQEAVKRYILEQEGKPVFEYDIFNCPTKLKGQMTIGDFTNGGSK